jgi:hypothetical protein
MATLEDSADLIVKAFPALVGTDANAATLHWIIALSAATMGQTGPFGQTCASMN